MKRIDRWLQDLRFAAVRPHLRCGCRVLDIGSADGALARRAPQLGEYLGIDPCADVTAQLPQGTLIRGDFPQDMPRVRPFDVICLLAVFEHVRLGEQAEFVAGCHQYLVPGGRLVVTVPSPLVDWILHLLRGVGLIDGMHLEEHYGFDAARTPRIFSSAYFSLLHHRRFELGLNHLFVFAKPTVTSAPLERLKGGGNG